VFLERPPNVPLLVTAQAACPDFVPTLQHVPLPPSRSCRDAAGPSIPEGRPQPREPGRCGGPRVSRGASARRSRAQGRICCGGAGGERGHPLTGSRPCKRCPLASHHPGFATFAVRAPAERAQAASLIPPSSAEGGSGQPAGWLPAAAHHQGDAGHCDADGARSG
jgi:hypothetical protein